MAIRTVGDLLNLPNALTARMQQKEFESQQRAGEFVAKLFGEEYNPYASMYGYGQGYGYGLGGYSNNQQSSPRLTQSLSEIIDPSELINNRE